MDKLIGETAFTQKMFFPVFLTKHNGQDGMRGAHNVYWKNIISRLYNIVHGVVVPMYTKVRYADYNSVTLRCFNGYPTPITS